MAQFLWIPWQLPRLNELLDQRGRVFTKKAGAARASRSTKAVSGRVANGYSVLKKQWEQQIWMLARGRGFHVLPGCWDFSYLFVEPNAKFDPSNISSAAVKLIEDALQGKKTECRQSLMDGDGWGTVHSVHCHFVQVSELCPVPGVLLAVSNKPLELQELVNQTGVMTHAERFHRRQRNLHADYAIRQARERVGGIGRGPSLDRESSGAPATRDSGVPAGDVTEDGCGPAVNHSGER